MTSYLTILDVRFQILKAAKISVQSLVRPVRFAGPGRQGCKPYRSVREQKMLLEV
jgi:hypothetical protein